MNKIEQFDPEIKKIEEDVIQFLVNLPLFMGEKPIYSIIKAYFITREELTQSALKELTGFSSGAISQELNKLIKKDLIKITKTSSKGRKVYSMKSVVSAFITLYTNTFKDIPKWEKELQGIKSELEKHREELKDLNGYNSIYKWVNIFLRTMPLTQLVTNLLKEEKAALGNI